MFIASTIMGIIVYVLIPAEGRIRPIKLALSIILLFLGTIISYYIPHIVLRILFLSIILSILIKVFYSFTLVSSIVLSITSYFLYALGDIFSSLIVINGFGFDYSVVKQSFVLSLSTHGIILAISVFFAIIISLMRKHRNNLGKLIKFPIKRINFTTVFFIYLIITIVLISILGELHISIVMRGENQWVILIACAIIIYFIISLIIIYFYDIVLKEKFKNDEKEKQYKQLLVYTEVIEGLIKNLRTYQHNYTNTLASIKGFVEQKNIESLEKYLNEEVFKDTNTIITGKDVFSPLQKISNPGIKGLVATKINNAMNNNIQFSVEVTENMDFSAYQVETIDICKIIGILLDNAIEAAMESEKKNISLLITKNKKETSFVITNTFKNPPDINKMFNYGYSTKGKNRGIGLSIVKDILNTKYSNLLLNTIVEEDTFIAELIMCKP
jgi:two-component system sensor histidine kinase AgrC